MKVLFILDHPTHKHVKYDDEGNYLGNIYWKTAMGKNLSKKIKDFIKEPNVKPDLVYAVPDIPDVVQTDNYGKPKRYKKLAAKDITPVKHELLQYIIQNKPDIVVPLGKVGCGILLGKDKIMQLRGEPEHVTVTHEEDSYETWVLPTFSMEYLEVNRNKQRVSDADFTLIGKFASKGNKAFEADQSDYTFVDTIEEAERILTKEVYSVPVVAWDLETNTLEAQRAGAKPLVITLCTEIGTGYTIPLEHKDFPWKGVQLERIYQWIRDFLASTQFKVGHNLTFDIRFLRLTKDFNLFVNNMDTKILFYMLISQEKDDAKDLSTLAYEFTEMGGYDRPLLERKKAIKEAAKAKFKEEKVEADRRNKEQHRKALADEKAKAKEEGRRPVKMKAPSAIPVEVLRNEVDGGDFNYEWFDLIKDLHPYASGDVDCCLRIFYKLDEVGKKFPRIRALYTKEYPRLTFHLAMMEADGVKMDVPYNEHMETQYAERLETLTEELRKYPQVQQLEEEHRELYTLGVTEFNKPKLNDANLKKNNETWDSYTPENYRDEQIEKYRGKYKGDLSKFNPNSDSQVQRVLLLNMGLTLPFSKDFVTKTNWDNGIKEEDVEWHHYSVGAKAIEYLVDKNPEHKDFLETFHLYKKTQKLISGYMGSIRKLVTDQDILHFRLNITGTECVSGDTLLVTDEGIKEIQNLSNFREERKFQDISIGVHSHEGEERADGFYYNGYRTGNVIELEDGTVMKTSLNHPLLKNNWLSVPRKALNRNNGLFEERLKDTSWVESGTLKKGDYIALKANTQLYGDTVKLNYDKTKYRPTATSHTKRATIPEFLSEELAEFIGMYMADGSISRANKSYNLTICNNDPNVLSHFSGLVKTLFNLDTRYSQYNEKAATVTFSCKHVGDWLTDVVTFGKKAFEKDVPNIILSAPKNIQQAFIRGITLDSSTKKRAYPSLVLATTSPSLSKKVRVMLLNMGIHTRVSYAFKEGYNPTIMLALTSKNLEKFIKDIGMIQCEKVEYIQDKINNHSGRKPKTIGVIPSEEYIFVKVKEIRKENMELFDLHVPKSHSFVGNGVVNHNTSRLSSDSPNMQNTPRKSNNPKDFSYQYPIKRQFISRFEGGVVMQADFSSLEARILAIAAEDDVMLRGILEGKDTHTETACLMYNCEPDEVTDDMRTNAKAVN